MIRAFEEDGNDSRVHRVRMTRMGVLVTSAAFAGMLLAGPQVAHADEQVTGEGGLEPAQTSQVVDETSSADNGAAASVEDTGATGTKAGHSAASSAGESASTSEPQKAASTTGSKLAGQAGSPSQTSASSEAAQATQGESKVIASSAAAPSGYREVDASHASDKGVVEKRYKTDVDGIDADHEISKDEYDQLKQQADTDGKVKTGTDYYYRGADASGKEVEHPATKEDYDQPDHKIIVGYTYYKINQDGKRSEITKEQYDAAQENGGKIADGTEYYYVDQAGVPHYATEQDYAEGSGTAVIGHNYFQVNENGTRSPITKEEYDEAVANGKGKYIRTDYTYTDAGGKTVATDEQTYIARPDHTVLIGEHWYREDGTEITKAQYDAAMADQVHPGQTLVRTDYFYEDKDGKRQPATAEQYAGGKGKVVINQRYFYYNPSAGVVYIDKDAYDKAVKDGGITMEVHFLFVPTWDYQDRDGLWHSRKTNECYTPDANPVPVIHIVEDANQAVLPQRSEYGYFYQNARGEVEDLPADTVEGVTPTTQSRFALRGHVYDESVDPSGWSGVPVFFDSADPIKAQGGDGSDYWITVDSSYQYDPNGTIRVYLELADVDANGYVNPQLRTIETYTVTPRTGSHTGTVGEYSETAPVQKQDIYQKVNYRPSYATVDKNEVYVPVEAEDVTTPVLARTIWAETQAEPQYATVEARDHFIGILTRWFAPIQQAHAQTGGGEPASDEHGVGTAVQEAGQGNHASCSDNDSGAHNRASAASSVNPVASNAGGDSRAIAPAVGPSQQMATSAAPATSPETGADATGPLAALVAAFAAAAAAFRRLRRRA